MLVHARLELFEAEQNTSSRRLFWQEFTKLARRSGTETPLPEYNSIASEMSIFHDMPFHLEENLNRKWTEDGSGPSLRRRALRRDPNRITVKVRNVSYGSMDIVLEVLGISKDTAQDTILSLLEIYLPVAINETFGTEISMHVTANRLGGDSAPAATRGSRIFALVNSTFLIPIGLIFAICYIVFGEMRKEMDGLKAREDKLISEASNVFSKLLEQNAKLSEIVLDRAKTEKLKAAVGPANPGG